jgi:glutathione S-transferase
MIPTVTVFERSPDRGRGLARDMRVRWALEEVGQPYNLRLASFAALNTVELPIVEYSMATILERDKSWYAERLVMLEERCRVRLGELSVHLGNKEWLEGAFSAADLMMVTVLRRLEGSGLIEEFPNVAAYVARGEARPAYKRAFAAQREVFESH